MPGFSSTRLATRLALLGVLILPTLAHANLGIPFSIFVVGFYWTLLITVVVVEAFVLHKRLPLKAFKAFGVSLLVNFVSALLGTFLLPIAEGIAESAGYDIWDPLASKMLFFFFLIPNYLLSVWLEARIALHFVKLMTYGDVVKVFYRANVYSYLLLLVLVIVLPLPIG